MQKSDMVVPKTIFSFAFLFAALSVNSEPQVPCTFFFGDSQFDNGNNNEFLSLAKVDYRPYGIDYPTVPPRFSNGFNVPDYLAQLLGYENPIPSFTKAIKDSNILNGVNYASAGVGILDETGSQLGGHFTMNAQLLNHEIVIKKTALMRRSNIFSIKTDYFTKCLYVINIGANDYLNNYLLRFYPTRLLYTQQRYAQLLIEKLSQQLMILYNQGARKVAVYGIGLLGCIPQQIATANASGCVDSVNNIVQLFNVRLKLLIENLNNELHSAQFTFINASSISTPSIFASLGITVQATPCCKVSRIVGLCLPKSIPCSNRSIYAFWDNYHTTSIVNQAAAARAYHAALPTDASPVDIQRLVQK